MKHRGIGNSCGRCKEPIILIYNYREQKYFKTNSVKFNFLMFFAPLVYFDIPSLLSYLLIRQDWQLIVCPA